jgi:hypothetical protein
MFSIQLNVFTLAKYNNSRYVLKNRVHGEAGFTTDAMSQYSVKTAAGYSILSPHILRIEITRNKILPLQAQLIACHPLLPSTEKQR